MTEARHAQLGRIWIRSAKYSALLFVYPLIGTAFSGKAPEWPTDSLGILALAYLGVWNATALVWIAYEAAASALRRACGVRKARAIGGLLAVLGFGLFLGWLSLDKDGPFTGEYAQFSLTVFCIAAMLAVAARCVWILTRRGGNQA